MWAPKVPKPSESWVWTQLLNSVNVEQRGKLLTEQDEGIMAWQAL